jgi:hypothetical protein
MFFLLVRYRSPASIKAERTTGVPGRSSNLATSRVLLDYFLSTEHHKPSKALSRLPCLSSVSNDIKVTGERMRPKNVFLLNSDRLSYYTKVTLVH